MTDVADRIGNVTRQRYEQLVTQAKELIAQIARSQFALGDMALEIEPMRMVGGSMPNGTDDLFTVTESLQLFADDIGVERRTVEDWRYTANRWPAKRRREGVSFTAFSPRGRAVGGDRGATPDDVDRFWQAFLRRFDLEHTFRFAKQTLGWTAPKLRTPEAADRWTWLLIVAHTQLRLARPLAPDLRRPWEKSATSGRLTPARVRRGFRNIRAHLACPARVPKPRGAGPGDGHPAPTTSTGYPATTSARPSNAPRPSRPSASLEDLGR